MKGVITLFDSDGKELESSQYGNAKDRKVLYNAWKQRYTGEGIGSGYYFIISPIAEFKLTIDQQLKWGKMFYDRGHPEKKEPLVRAKAEYGNISSPYGIADELHKSAPIEKRPYKRKPNNFQLPKSYGRQ